MKIFEMKCEANRKMPFKKANQEWRICMSETVIKSMQMVQGSIRFIFVGNAMQLCILLSFR